MRVNLRLYKMRKTLGLFYFHSLYQLLRQVYRNRLKLCISNLKICIDK